MKESNEINDRSISEIQSIVEILSANKLITISLEESKRILENQFSGNLDAKEIRKIAKAYGIHFDKQSTQVRVIEQMRNALAHGEVSFEEGSRNYDIIYMRILKDKSIEFIAEFITSVETYISTKRYKK